MPKMLHFKILKNMINQEYYNIYDTHTVLTRRRALASGADLAILILEKAVTSAILCINSSVHPVFINSLILLITSTGVYKQSYLMLIRFTVLYLVEGGQFTV